MKKWQPGDGVFIGDYREHKGEAYFCLQNHITQSVWPPDKTPVYWMRTDKDNCNQEENSHETCKYLFSVVFYYCRNY